MIGRSSARQVRRRAGSLGALAAILGLVMLLTSCGRREGRVFLLLSIDALRADHLGAYGYPRGTSPTIDRLAARSALFVECLSVSSWTMPAMGTLGTGLRPAEHGMVYWHLPLQKIPETLAEVLGERNVATAFIGNPIPRLPGLERGFEVWEFYERDDRAAVARAIEWLDQNRTRNRFLWVHLLSPHAPYDPLPQTLRSEPGLAEMTVLYDGEIRTVDLYVRELLNAVGPHAGILFTADHGETLDEREELRYDHGMQLYEELLRIPCLLRLPGVSAEIRSERIRLADIPATVCDWFGVDAPRGSRGRSLLPLVENQERPPSEPVYAWVVEDDPPGHKDQRWSVHDGNLKAVFNVDRGTARLFDLARDPGERVDVAAERSDDVARLGRLLAEERAAAPAPRIPFHLRFSPERIERLRSLGYLGGAGGGADTTERSP
jgi:arylsulfatase A-like enzyme